MSNLELRHMAEGWRIHASGIQAKFTRDDGTVPFSVQAVVLAFENCAETLEQYLKGAARTEIRSEDSLLAEIKKP